MRQEGNTIYADEGKVIRRKADFDVVGVEYTLGTCYRLYGKKLEEPFIETAEDFEDLEPEVIRAEQMEQYPILVEQFIRTLYSVSDELAIQRQRDEKPEAFKEYYDYCEKCKYTAKKRLGIKD